LTRFDLCNGCVIVVVIIISNHY